MFKVVYAHLLLWVSWCVIVAVCLFAIDAQSCETEPHTVAIDIEVEIPAPTETDCDAVVYDDDEVAYHLVAYDDGICHYTD